MITSVFRLKHYNIKLKIIPLLLLFSLAGCVTENGPTLSLATGGKTGIYYPTGKKICDLYNASLEASITRCKVQSTKGSRFNLVGLKNGNYDTAVVHSNWAKNSFNGEKYSFKDKPNPKLRALFSLFSESFTIIAKKDHKIIQLDDLVGRKIDLGAPNTLSREIFDQIMHFKGWNKSSFIKPTEIKRGKDKVNAFCAGTADVVMNIVGHPSGYTKKMIQSCDGKIISLDEKTIAHLIKIDPSLSLSTIPADYYSQDVQTASSVAHRPMLITSEDLPEEIAYHFTKSTLENLDELSKVFPALKFLKREQMGTNSIAIPLHEGAKRYYKETNLLD